MNYKIARPLTESLIVLEKEKQYGCLRYYPRNRMAFLLCQLTGTKTLTETQQDILKSMGCTISYDYTKQCNDTSSYWEDI